MKLHDPIEWILTIYRERGQRQYGEEVTEMQHALQAATFAQESGESDPIIVAALLHDFGHLLHDQGEDIAEQGIDMSHETLGADKLSGLFAPEVIEPIRLHVAAKRYLCWQDRGYFDGLSAASRLSLDLQGGVMSDQEASDFERHSHSQAAIRIRRYDDRGKVAEMKTPVLSDFRVLLASLLIVSA